MVLRCRKYHLEANIKCHRNHSPDLKEKSKKAKGRWGSNVLTSTAVWRVRLCLWFWLLTQGHLEAEAVNCGYTSYVSVELCGGTRNKLMLP